MSATSPDVHVRFDTHPAHPSAVTAHLTGTLVDSAHDLLTGRGFEPLDEHTVVLARIDHEEPYWANQADQELTGQGITTEITPRLREVIHEEWTWAEHPMSWLTRSEIRDVSNEAQQIHDDIRNGHLIIHAHADDHGTTVAVGTYRGTGQSVYLHGENHLRCVVGTFDSIAEALTAFEHAHRGTLRPGPAPMTDTEHQAAHARTSLQAASPPTAPLPVTEEVPAYAADPGDHEAVFDVFLDTNGDWEKYRTWYDNTTIANHESLTVRILFDHGAGPREATWALAAYESPVSERMWHMALTSTVPAPVLKALLSSLAAGDAQDSALGSPVETTVTEVVRPLADIGWMPAVDGRCMHWNSEQGEVGIQFNAFAAHDSQVLDTWTMWGGPSINHPVWTIRASAYTPVGLLSAVAGELAHGIGTHRTVSRTMAPSRQHTTALPPAAPPPHPPASPLPTPSWPTTIAARPST